MILRVGEGRSLNSNMYLWVSGIQGYPRTCSCTFLIGASPPYSAHPEMAEIVAWPRND